MLIVIGSTFLLACKNEGGTDKEQLETEAETSSNTIANVPVHTQKPSQAAIGTRYRPRQYDCHDSSAGREYLGSEFSYLLLGREPSIPW